MTDTKKLLTLAVEIGDAMLRCGAEIYRVEDTVIRILEAFGMEEFDVYVLSNGIFASANESRGDACSVVRHVPLASTHLGRLTELNQLTRDICGHTCTLEQASARLEECRRMPAYPSGIQILACAVGCAMFTLLFGGGWQEACYAFLIGLLEQALLFLFARQKLSRFLTTIYVSVCLSLLAMPAPLLGLLQDKVVIGSIMPLVPGVAFTTSIRDFYNGDYLSGTIHLIDAMLTGLCIAVGVFLPVLALRFWGGM